MTENRKVQIEATLDATGVKAGASEVKREVQSMAQEVKKSSDTAGKAVDSIGNGGAESAKKVDSATRSMIQSIQRTTAVMEAGSRSSSKYYEVLASQRGVDVGALKPYLTQLDQVTAKQKAAEQAMLAANPAMQKLGISAAQTTAALRGMPAQFTDIITSLQGGQRPISVLLQQGGQLKDMFGGIGPAARALSGYVVGLINPFTLAAGAASVLAIAYNQGSKEADAYRKSLILTGNAAGTTANQLAEMAARVGGIVGTQGNAAAALAELAGTGQIAARNLEEFSRVAVQMEKTVGKSVADTAKELAELGNSPLEASEKLNEKYRYLTASVYEQIKALQDQGKADEAAALAQKTYASAFDARSKEIVNNLGLIERGWNSVVGAAKSGWDAILNVGRGSTGTQQIDAVASEIARRQAQLSDVQKIRANDPSRNTSGTEARIKAEIEGLRLQQSLLQENERLERRSANAAGASTRQEQARIEWLKEGDKYLPKAAQMEREIAAARAQGQTAGASLAEIEERIGNIRDKYKDKSAGTSNTEVANARARLQAEQEYLAQLRLNGAAAEKLNDGEQESIKYAKQLEGMLNSKTRARTEELLAIAMQRAEILRQTDAEARSVEATKAATAARTKYIDSLASGVDKLKADVIAQREFNERIGLSKTAIAEFEAAKLNDQATTLEGIAIKALDKNLDQEQYDLTMAQVRLLREKAGLKVAGAATEIAFDVDKKALDDLNAYLDTARAESFGDALSKAFQGAGNSLAALSNAFVDFAKKQEESEKARGNAAQLYLDGKIDETQYEKERANISKRAAKEQINSYANMAGAAKGFFREGTRGYKALEAAENTFRAFQLASDLAKGMSAAAVGVATQAQGDPYTAFPRMAAMAAAMAALGFATGSFGGGNKGAIDVKARQAAQGTGTVFGDAEAKSESISKALDSLRDNSNIGLDYSSQMLDALRNIESSMAGLANIILRSSGITSGNSMNIFEGVLSVNKGDPLGKSLTGFNDSSIMTKLPGLGPVIEKLHAAWGKTTQKIVDSGLSINGTVSDLMDGRGIQQYADIEKKKSSWFGLKKKYSNSTQFADVDDALAQQFGMIFGGVSDALTAAAGPLKINADQVSKQVADTLINIPKISLRGLKGQELQDALNAVLSGAADSISQKILPGLDDFQRIGEGYFETVIRVASGVEMADAALQKFNLTAVNYKDIINKQGDVSAEIVRQSIITKETYQRSATESEKALMRFAASFAGVNIDVTNATVSVVSGIGDIIGTLDGSAQDIASVYSSLLDVRKLLQSVGIDGNALGRSMIQGSGDLGALSGGLTAYFENFFSKEEQTARRKQNLSDSFAQIGVAVPASLQGFRQLVNGIDTTTAAGQKLFGQLILLSGEFADVQKTADDAITGMLRNIVDKFGSAAASLRAYLDSILAGAQSPLSAERIAALARAKFESTYAATKSTDRATALGAMQDLQGVSQSYLQTALNGAGTSVDYARAVGKVMAAVEDSAIRAEGQVTIAQRQLDTLTSLSSTAEEIKAILAQSAGLSAGRIVELPGFAVGTNYVPHDMSANIHAGERIIPAADNRELMERLRSPSDNSAALAAEIKQLRAELQAAHIAIAKNTGDTAKILRKFDGDGMPAERVLTA